MLTVKGELLAPGKIFLIEGSLPVVIMPAGGTYEDIRFVHDSFREQAI
jgi:hypothetical protein